MTQPNCNLAPTVSVNFLQCGSKSVYPRSFLLLSTVCLCLSTAPAKANTARTFQVASEQAASERPAPTANAEDLVRQGRTLYDSGQFTQAAQVFQQAARAFRGGGDALRQAMALGNLSLTYQHLGQWSAAEKSISDGLVLLREDQNQEKSLQQPQAEQRSLQVLAQLHDIEGRLELERGRPQAALTRWQQAAAAYTQLDDPAKLWQSRINMAQAQQALGRYRQARSMLLEAKTQLASQSDSILKATGLRSLGNVFRVVGDLQLSQQALEESLAIMTQVSDAQNTQDQVSTRLSLGRTLRAQGEIYQALALFQSAANSTDSLELQTQAQLQELSLRVANQELAAAEALWPQLVSQIKQLPSGRTAIYASVFLSEILAQLETANASGAIRQSSSSSRESAQLLAASIQQAKYLGDLRAESLALGALGKIYEKSQQQADAIDLTQKALLLSQSLDLPDLSYQWQWQLGRLQQSEGEIEASIASYSDAVNNLQTLRQDLATLNPEVQFSFRDKVEPVYRELVSLLLLAPDGIPPSQAQLQQARTVLESLKIAELENYFRSACLDATETIDKVVDQQDSNAAVLYPVVLKDRLALILKIPRQEQLEFFSTEVSQGTFEETVNQLQVSLPDITRVSKVKQSSQQVYDWLIRPIEQTLAANEIDTLTFALDGPLRNIPMAVLYDQQRQQYLVEKYAIALAPSLQLVTPKPLKKVPLNVLAAGINEQRIVEGREFAPLSNVSNELSQIDTQLSNSQNLINQRFTVKNLTSTLRAKPFSIVHIATHGEFSSSLDNTYLLTWNQLLKGNELATLLQQSDDDQNGIELLVLSACQTAVGDERATLGLAGIAVQAGARSTLATLWSIDDQSTSVLMSQFYQALKAGQTKAEALRTAQLAALDQDRRPYLWAPYVLVGNWL
ncbi:CHAT domain-containing protein [Acaryochloris thomasi]|nr:CHAT domain-containing protein [Acaryochloris thomasi]